MEGCTSDEDNNDVQNLDDINSFSQESVLYDNKKLDNAIPKMVYDVVKLEDSMICSNEKGMLKPMVMPCELIQSDGCEQLVQVDIPETNITNNDTPAIPLQITLHTVNQIVPQFPNHENICKPTSVVVKDEVQRDQNNHDGVVEAYEDHNIEYLCCEDYNAESCSSLDCDSFMTNEDECDLEIGSSFSEVSNALFDEDIDMDQPVLCLNIFERGFHLISNPLYEEIIENPGILNVDQNGIVDLINEDEFYLITCCNGSNENILNHCEHGLYDKEGAIRADQGILFVFIDSDIQNFESGLLISYQLSEYLIRRGLDDDKCKVSW